MKRRTKTRVNNSHSLPPPYDKGIWWLLERDLRCWASVLHGRKDGRLHVATFLYGRHGKEGYAHVLRAHGDGDWHELVVEKISEEDLLTWWRKILEIEGCTWDEAHARAKFNFLLLKYEELDLLRNALASLNTLLGNAAPVWLRMAAEKHYCPGCREEEERLTHSSSLPDVLKKELEQAHAHYVALLNSEKLIQGNPVTVTMPGLAKRRCP